MKLEERINNEVEYWMEEYEHGELNLFKLELEDGECVENIDEKLISEHVSSIYQKGNYAYIEIYQIDLDRYCDDKWKEWEFDRKLEIEEYWNSRW